MIVGVGVSVVLFELGCHGDFSSQEREWPHAIKTRKKKEILHLSYRRYRLYASVGSSRKLARTVNRVWTGFGLEHAS